MTSALVLYISRLITTKEELLTISLACLISKFSCSCLVTVSSLSVQADEAVYEPGPKLARATGVTPGETYELWICSSLSKSLLSSAIALLSEVLHASASKI